MQEISYYIIHSKHFYSGFPPNQVSNMANIKTIQHLNITTLKQYLKYKCLVKPVYT